MNLTFREMKEIVKELIEGILCIIGVLMLIAFIMYIGIETGMPM